jgi:hypothetical protein
MVPFLPGRVKSLPVTPAVLQLQSPQPVNCENHNQKNTL